MFYQYLCVDVTRSQALVSYEFLRYFNRKKGDLPADVGDVNQ